MKTKFTYAIVLLIAAGLFSCKKTGKIDQELAGSESKLAAAVAPNTVETIAGTKYTYQPGEATLVDGPAKTARFYFPFGLAMRDDGSFFIADRGNDKIRKVSPQGIVSTVELQSTSNGQYILQPTLLCFDDSNNLHIITREDDITKGYTQSWIYAPDKSVKAVYWRYNGNFYSLAKDPYENTVWFSDGIDIAKHKVAEVGTPGNDYRKIGTDYQVYDKSKLPASSDPDRTFNAMYVGYNKVKYVSLGDKIFKLTPSGVFEQIFTNFTFTFVTSIIASKDGRTMYIADSGAIRKIENNKITTLAGPNKTYTDGRDGVGTNADVSASQLILGKGENVIYFVDYRAFTLRKLTLK